MKVEDKTIVRFCQEECQDVERLSAGEQDCGVLLSKNGKEEFEGFFERYAPMFKDAPMKEVGGEQDLEFYAIFQKYLRLYETVLEGYIEKLDASQVCGGYSDQTIA